MRIFTYEPEPFSPVCEKTEVLYKWTILNKFEKHAKFNFLNKLILLS